MNGVPAPAAVPAETPAAEYKLFVREGTPRFYLKNDDEGIYLSPKGIGWFITGRSFTRDWSDIAAVNLVVAHVPKQGPAGTCQISFRDGSAITVLSASKWGQSDTERNVEYGRFLDDLHRSIPRGIASSIKFWTGVSKGRHAVLIVVLVVAFLCFVALPAVLAVYFRDFSALLIAGGGLAFVYPLYLVTERGAPATYDPDRVPPDFYP